VLTAILAQQTNLAPLLRLRPCSKTRRVAIVLAQITSQSGKGIRRGILDVACIIRHFRSCLQHDRGGGNHSLFKGCELGVSHVGEPPRDRFSREMKIYALRWTAIAAV
jgi:hypothetical protein